jgi:hypothetical protein
MLVPRGEFALRRPLAIERTDELTVLIERMDRFARDGALFDATFFEVGEVLEVWEVRVAIFNSSVVCVGSETCLNSRVRGATAVPAGAPVLAYFVDRVDWADGLSDCRLEAS